MSETATEVTTRSQDVTRRYAPAKPYPSSCLSWHRRAFKALKSFDTSHAAGWRFDHALCNLVPPMDRISTSANAAAGAMDRRSFLRRCGRWLGLGGGAAAGLRLVSRGQLVLHGERCTREGICAGCASADTCGLPAALSRRRRLGTGNAS